MRTITIPPGLTFNEFEKLIDRYMAEAARRTCTPPHGFSCHCRECWDWRQTHHFVDPALQRCRYFPKGL